MNSLTHGAENGSDTTAINNKEAKHASRRLLAHRVYRSLEGTMSLAENLQNIVYDQPDTEIDEAELNKINEEIVKLQERLIKVVKV